jgi:hypothetical protein
LRLFKRAFKKAKINTCTSSAQVEKLKELFALDNFEIIRTGVDVERISNSKREVLLDDRVKGKKICPIPRFISPIYNIELQVDALEYLSHETLRNHIFVFIKGKSIQLRLLQSIVRKTRKN